jgi:hypothetical protein
MKFQRREMILASIVGGLLLLAAVWLLFMVGDSRPIARLIEDHKKIAAEVEAKQKLLEVAKHDAKRITDWRRRSLPANADPSVAPLLYQKWLLTLAERAHIGQKIDFQDAGSKHEKFSFTLNGHATLADLTQFLYQFYSAGHLHQIRHMELKPQENSRELVVNMKIEALALPDADRKDQLSKEAGHGLHYAQLENYLEPIAKRDLFTSYVQSDRKPVDAAEYTFVTGITEVNGTRQVWLLDRMAGKKWILGEGGSFQVGAAHGTVKTIVSTREVIVEFDGHRRRLHEGENLRGGEAVEPEKTEKKDRPVTEHTQATEKTGSQADKTDRVRESTAKQEERK